MNKKYTLYHYWRSSCSWRVRWALNYKQIPHDLIAVNLLNNEHKTQEYLKKNPFSYVPTLEIDGRYYTESLAMLEYLEESFPKRNLLPSDPESRLLIRQLTLTLIAGTQPLQNLSVLNYVAKDNDAKKKEFATYFIERGLQTVETLLQKQQCVGTYTFGSQLTFADLALIPQCYNALRQEIDLRRYPLIYKVYQNCLQTEACQSSSPEAHQPK